MGGGPAELPETPLPQPERDNTDDFVTVQHIPNSKPSRYIVQIRRWRAEQGYTVSQASEPVGRMEAQDLARKWGYWHRLEVRW